METLRTPVFHRYKVIEKIGSGGMGSVFKAHDLQLDRFVALKILPPALQEDEGALERFHREARALAHLNHPRVASVYDASTEGGFPHLVMELVEGENLERMLRRRRALSTAETARIGADVAEALAHIHSHRIVHRDVKTSNIIMEPHKGAVVADFGIALEASLPRLSQGALGTPEYMSPEQAEGRPLDGRSDLYSLGVVLFECLAGRPPFRREGESMASLMELMQRVTTEPVLPLATICPDVPRSLCDAVMRCLEKDPDERFSSASDLAELLRRISLERLEPAEPDMAPRSDVSWSGARNSSGSNSGPAWSAGTATREDVTVLLHLEAVQAVACGPGRRLASGSNDGLVRIWDAVDGRLLHVLHGHEGAVSAVAFSRDGRYVASADRMGKICLWDGGTGRLLREIDALSALVLTLAFSPDGRRLASGGADRAVRLWKVRSGKLADTVGHHQGFVLSTSFSGDGRRLATSGSDGQVLVWDLERSHVAVTIQAHRGWAMGVDFSPDGRRLVSGGADRRIRLWEAATGSLLQEIEGHRATVMSARFSPSGRYAASAGRDGAVHLWDARSGAPAGRIGTHEGAAMGLGFSPDGRHVAAACDDGTVSVWHIRASGFGPRRRYRRAAAVAVVVLAMGFWMFPRFLESSHIDAAWSRLGQAATGVSGWIVDYLPESGDLTDAGAAAPSTSETSGSAGRTTGGTATGNTPGDRTSSSAQDEGAPSRDAAHAGTDPRSTSRPESRTAGPPIVVPSDEPPPASPPARFHPLYGGGRLVNGMAGWTIEVGRLRTPNSAAFVAEQYRDMGYRTGILAVHLGERVEYLVGVGHFSTLLDANEVITRFRGFELPGDIRAERLRWDEMDAVR